MGSADPARAETFVRFDGPAEEVVQGGSATVNSAGGISIFFHGQASFTFEVAASAGERIRAGSYDAAAPFAAQPTARPGLSVRRDGLDCSSLGGRFVVHQAVYDEAGQIARFAADFAQRCDGRDPLFGSVRFNSDVPVRDGDGDGVIDIKDNCPAASNLDQSDVDADGIGSVCDPVQGVTAIVIEGPTRDGVSTAPPLSFGPRSGIRAFANAAGGVSLRVAQVALDFTPPAGRIFELGRFASGLQVASDRRGCSGREGRFEVLELQIGANGEVLHLAIDFEQRCEGSRSVLSGIVRFNSESIGAPELDIDADGVINLADSCPMDRNSDQTNRDGDELGDACDPYPDQRDNLNACQVENDSARSLRSANDAALAALLGQSVELRTENLALREENQRLRSALSDTDGDGVMNELDRCAGSASSAPVDASGCTRAQFCERIPLASFAAGLRCLAAGFGDQAPFASCSIDLSDTERGARCTAR